MAYEAPDGKKFTNRAPMMSHKRSLERASKRSEAGGVGVTDPLAQPTEEGHEDGAQVAQEHGPAVEVNVIHSHESGEHHVHSVHPDGHEHHSDHGSAVEAHDHAKQLAGGEHEDADGMDSNEDEPEYE